MKIKQFTQKLSLTHTEIERTYCIYFADYINLTNSKKYTDIPQRNILRTGRLQAERPASPPQWTPSLDPLASPSAKSSGVRKAERWACRSGLRSNGIQSADSSKTQ